MAGSAVMGVPSVDEAELARAAKAGDGRAFAELYRHYEGRLFNAAHRISGSEEIAVEAAQRAFRSMMGSGSRPPEGALELGPYLLMETRNACHDLMARRGDAGSSAALANGNGNLPDEQEAVGRASMRLPERQREALALRELGELSYGEIAAIMETQHDSVAQLISRGRINLSDELHGTVLASVAAPSSECERALPLIAMRDDGQLDAGSADAAWLDAHLASCERCGMGVEAMQGAADSYRSWAPLAVPPSLLKSTMAMAAELAGAAWNGEIAEAAATGDGGHPRGSQGRSRRAPHARIRRPSRGAALAAGLAALLLLAGLAAFVSGDEQRAAPIGPATGKAARHGAATSRKEANPVKQHTARRQTARNEEETVPTGGGGTVLLPAPTDSTAAPTTAGSKPDNQPKEASVQAPQETQQPSPSKHSPSPKPTPTASPTPTSTPPPAPTTTTTTTPEPAPIPEPLDASPGNSHGKAEPPGKPPDRGPK